FRDDIEWRNLHLFWGDEHAGQSNINLAWEDGGLKTVYDDGLLLPENYHPIQLDKTANLSKGRLVAEYYATEIHKTVGQSGFDLSIIGLGKDCHTMSLIPEKGDFVNFAFPSQNLVEAINYPPDLYPGIGLRVTMTPLCLSSLSRRNVMFVTGQDKSSALKEILSGDIDLHRKPGSLIQLLQDPLIITDEAAASLL
ncbi:6-phosphogluconolactonase, partial [Chloroflexota bacterium]